VKTPNAREKYIRKTEEMVSFTRKKVGGGDWENCIIEGFGVPRTGWARLLISAKKKKGCTGKEGRRLWHWLTRCPGMK